MDEDRCRVRDASCTTSLPPIFPFHPLDVVTPHILPRRLNIFRHVHGSRAGDAPGAFLDLLLALRRACSTEESFPPKHPLMGDFESLRRIADREEND